MSRSIIDWISEKFARLSQFWKLQEINDQLCSEEIKTETPDEKWSRFKVELKMKTVRKPRRKIRKPPQPKVPRRLKMERRILKVPTRLRPIREETEEEIWRFK